MAIKQGEPLLPHARERPDPTLLAKDGKARFDPAVDPKKMRKQAARPAR